MTYDFENQRPREIFNINRVKGVQDDTVTMEPAFEQTPVIEEDIVIDQAGHLRTLVVRDGDSTNGPSEHISYAGQSLDREHASQFQGPGLPYDHAGNNGRAAEDHSTLKTYTRNATMMAASITASTAANPPSFGTSIQCEGMPTARGSGGANDVYSDNRGPLMAFPHTSTNDTGGSNLSALHVGHVQTGISRQDLAYVWLRGHTANGGPQTGPNDNHMCLVFGESTGTVNVCRPNDHATGMFSEAQVPLNWDWHALKMVHSTATDFFLQWRQELTSLRTFIQHFSQNESLGFYERSGRGTLWNAIDHADLPVAMWLTHLGYLQRVGVLPDNVIKMQGEDNSFAGFYNPFLLRVRNWDGNQGVREWMPDWVARLVDNANFSYAANKPEYGISLEDLFMGYTALMKAIALEQGMSNRSWWTPHMEFFDNTQEGKTHNFNTEESRTSVQMVRSLNMLGMENRFEFLNPNIIPDPLNRLSFAYFNDFFQNGQINNVAQMDHRHNMEDLENIQGLMTLTEEFKSGMQQLGISSGTRYVETLRDGAVVNVKTNIIPVANWRVSTSCLWWSTGGTDTFITGPIRESFRFANTLDFSDAAVLAANGTPIGITADQSVTIDVPTLWSNNWGNWASVHFDVPSAAAGWNQFDSRAQHARTQTFVGAGLDAGIRNWILAHIGDFGYGTCTDPLGNYLSGGNDVGTFHEAYWSPGRNNMFVHLYRAYSDLLKYWSTSHTALPRKSNLEIPQPSALNLIREMTMMQGESLIQKNIQPLLHFLHCGMSADFYSLQDRVTLDRQLDNADIHVRPARFAQAAGADHITFLLPADLVPEDSLEVITLGDMLFYRMGIKKHTAALVEVAGLRNHGAVAAEPGGGTANRIAHTLQMVSPATRHYKLWSRISAASANNALGNATTGRGAGDGGESPMAMNAVRYFVIGNRFRDGEIEYIESLVNETDQNTQVQRMNLNGPDSLFVNTPMYNYILGAVELGYIAAFNSAMFVPGYLEYYQSWPLTLNAAQANAAGNSLCGIGGLLMDPVDAGSNVDGLEGYAVASPAMTEFMLQAGLPAHLQLVVGDVLIADNRGFEPELWRRICDVRGGIDDWAWLRHDWRMIGIDQDVLDFDRGMFRALCAGNRLLVYGPSLRHVVIDRTGEIVREQDAIYTTGSLGGVAIGKGKYSEDEEVDLDGDVRTENGYEG